MAKASIPERFIHALWRERENYLTPSLVLSDGSPVTILDHGTFNDHRGGPDFLDARIAIEELAISGDIEIHRQPKHWREHKHDSDTRYRKVILHVVLETDDDSDHAPFIPTLVLRDNLSTSREELWNRLFETLYDRSPELPCFPHNMLVPYRYKRKVVDRFGEARLEELIARFDARNAQEFEQKLYRSTLDALGYSQNRTPFGELAEILSLGLLRELSNKIALSDRPLYFEALYFGSAGLLPQPDPSFTQTANAYLTELRSAWEAVQQIVSIPMTLSIGDWAFFRIRPLNSPYRRVALAASMAERYFSSDLDLSLTGIERLTNAETGRSAFWESHTSFAQPLETPHALLGKERAEALLLNVLIPARLSQLLSSSTKKDSQEFRALWLGRRSAASAKYLDVIEQELLEGERIDSVGAEQGALYLSRNYCEKLRCAECPIGGRLIDKGWDPAVRANR